MKRTTLLSLGTGFVAIVLMSVAGYGCGDDDDTPVTPKPDVFVPPSEAGGDTSVPDGGGPSFPPVPTLGAQIDRMGRPAVNTALNNTFNDDSDAGGIAKDNWNKDSNQAGWVAAYTAEVASNLAVYDGLDTNCGNQAAASMDASAQNSNVQKYGTLGGVLSNDRLWMNSAGTTAAQYLAVELNALGIANTDRGGRTLPMDVIDVTYSALAAGTVSGVTDGVAADATKTGGTAFPYLAAPLP